MKTIIDTAILGSLVYPELLGEDGVLRLWSSAYYDRIDPVALKVWCFANARYGLPTTELVVWLKEKIGDRKAIEIGSGHGDLAYHLGIQATDYRVQEIPGVREYYRRTGQPLIQYPSWVKRKEALSAIDKYEPEVVVASWVTQWIDPARLHDPGIEGCMYGVKEDELLETGVEYIFIGNKTVHSQKRILNTPHAEYQLPFIRSRSLFREMDVVYVWNER